MKQFIYLILLLLIVTVAACGGKNQKTNDDTNMALTDSVDANGLQRMSESKTETDITYKGKKYHAVIWRAVDEDMPHIANDMGDIYTDNKIALRITRDREQIFNQTFTKNNFSTVVDADFMAKAILEAIVFDKTTPEGIMFAGSISYPQTDLYVPVSLTITPDGKMTISKAVLLEDEYSDESGE